MHGGLESAHALMALEATVLVSIHKKSRGELTLSGLSKTTSQNVPAEKDSLGTDPFTEVEPMFAAKPAPTRIKTRQLNRLKEAAL